jgi:ERCC4-type nuclease
VCLILDDREESGLARALSVYDLSVSVARLEFGDCVFEGKGPSGPVMVAFERKHLTDLVTSMTDRRLSGHQMRGMSELYDYRYLVIEDNWRPSSSGGIEVWRGRSFIPLYSHRAGVNYRQIDSYIASLELRWGVIVCRTAFLAETAALYASRYMGWQKKWSDHHAHDVIYCPPPTPQTRRGKPFIATREPGLVELVAAQLPGIDRRAWAVGARFSTVAEMVLATEKEWCEIDGIGAITAKQVVAALHHQDGVLKL